MTALFQSKGQADGMLEAIRAISTTTPLLTKTLITATQEFASANIEASKIIPILKDLSNLSAASGRDQQQNFLSISKAVSQLATEGQAYSRQLNALAMAGIPIYESLANSLGVTIQRVRDMGRAGEISGEQVIEVLHQLGTSSRYGDIAKDQSQTFISALETLQEGIGFAIADGTKPLFNSIRDVTVAAANLTQSDQWRAWFTLIGTGAVEAGKSLKEMFAAFGPAGNGIADMFRELTDTGNVSAALANLKDGFTTTFTEIVQGAQEFAKEFFGAGYSLIESMAKGILSAGGDILTGAVTTVANGIASFLMGHSPPPEGPLHEIDEGGVNLIRTYAEGMKRGLPSVQEVVAGVAATFKNVTAPEGLDAMKASFAGATGNLKEMQQVGRDVNEVIHGLTAQTHDLDTASKGIKDEQRDLKDAYQALLDPIQRQLEALRQTKDVALELKQVELQRQDIQLRMSEEEAKGSVDQRVDLQSRLRAAQDTGRTLSIGRQRDDLEQQMADLSPESLGKKFQIDRAGLEDQRLTLRDRLNELRNPATLTAANQLQTLQERLQTLQRPPRQTDEMERIDERITALSHPDTARSTETITQLRRQLADLNTNPLSGAQRLSDLRENLAKVGQVDPATARQQQLTAERAAQQYQQQDQTAARRISDLQAQLAQVGQVDPHTAHLQQMRDQQDAAAYAEQDQTATKRISDLQAQLAAIGRPLGGAAGQLADIHDQQQRAAIQETINKPQGKDETAEEFKKRQDQAKEQLHEIDLQKQAQKEADDQKRKDLQQQIADAQKAQADERKAHQAKLAEIAEQKAADADADTQKRKNIQEQITAAQAARTLAQQEHQEQLQAQAEQKKAQDNATAAKRKAIQEDIAQAEQAVARERTQREEQKQAVQERITLAQKEAADAEKKRVLDLAHAQAQKKELQEREALAEQTRQKEIGQTERQIAAAKERAAIEAERRAKDIENVQRDQATLDLRIAREGEVEAKARKTAEARLEELRNQGKILFIQEELEKIQDKPALAAIAAAREHLKIEEARTENQKALETATKHMEEIPLVAQADALKNAYKDAKEPLDRQLESLTRARDLLTEQREKWTALRDAISDATAQQRADDKAAKDAAHDKPSKGLAGILGIDPEEFGGEVRDRINKMAGEMAKNLGNGMHDWLKEHSAELIIGGIGAGLGTAAGGTIGGAVGTALFGPIGGLIGGALGAAIGTGLGAVLGDQVALAVEKALGSQGTDFMTQLKKLGSDAAEAMGKLNQAFADTGVYDQVGRIWDNLKAAAGNLTSGMGELFGAVGDLLGRDEAGGFGGLATVAHIVLGPLEAVSKVIEGLGAVFKGTAGFVREHKELFVGLAAGLATFVGMQAAVTGITAVIGALGAAITGIAALSGTFALLTAGLSGMSAATAVLGGIVALLGGPVTIAIVAVAAAMALMTAAWVGNWGDIQGKTKAVVGFVKDHIGDLGDVLKAFVTGGPLGVFRLAWDKDWGGIQEKTGTVLDAITDGLVDSVKGWAIVFDTVETTVHDSLSDSAKGWEIVFDTVGTTIHDSLDESGKGWLIVFDTIGKGIDDWNTERTAAWNQFKDDTGQTFSDLGKNVHEALGEDEHSGLWGHVTDAWNGVKDTTAHIIGADGSTGLMGDIGSAFSDMVTNVHNLLGTDEHSGLWGHVTDGWNGIKGTITSYVGADEKAGIQEIVDKAFSNIGTKVRTLLGEDEKSGLWGAVTTGWNGIKNGIVTIVGAGEDDGLRGQVKRGFTNLGTTVGGVIDNGIKPTALAAWGKISEGIIGIGGIFDKLGTDVHDKLTAWGTAGSAIMGSIFSLGSGLLEQMAKGIHSGIDGTFNWIKENLIDALPNKIKEWLGIHSPSSVFEGIGASIMDGLMSGLRGKFDAFQGVVGAIQGVLSRLPGAGAGTANAAAAPVLGNASMVASHNLPGLDAVDPATLTSRGATAGLWPAYQGNAQGQREAAAVLNAAAGVYGSRRLHGTTRGAIDAMDAGTLDTVLQEAMGSLGVPSSTWLGPLRRLISVESGNDPNIFNDNDSNYDSGNPSIGLTQITLTTFAENAANGHENIMNPLDNVMAGIRYILNVKGGIERMPVFSGAHQAYDAGGWIMEPVVGVGLRTGTPHGFALNGVPEYVNAGGTGTGGAGIDYDKLAAAMSRAMAQNPTIQMNGLGWEEAVGKIQEHQQRQALMSRPRR